MWSNLIDVSYNALYNLWNGFIIFFPTLLGGVILLLLGIFIGNSLGDLVEKIVDLIKLDKALEKAGFDKIIDRAGLKLNSGYFLGQIVKWLIILAFLIATCNIWGLTEVATFIQNIVNYIPNVIVAVLILLISIVIGDYLAKSVKASLGGAGLRYKNFLGSLTSWTVIIFGLLAAMTQLKIAEDLIKTLFTGIVALLALAGGLAFGLGGKDLAQDLLKKIKEDLEEK
ncbi:MAG: mechanosensitive ion channel family protein [Minisyncoccia bacterium]|jgi:small-conductance mechanosensitive channel